MIFNHYNKVDSQINKLNFHVAVTSTDNLSAVCSDTITTVRGKAHFLSNVSSETNLLLGYCEQAIRGVLNGICSQKIFSVALA